MKMNLRARFALAGAVALSLLGGVTGAEEGATQAVFVGSESNVENAAFLGDGGSVELVQFEGLGGGLDLGASGCSHQIVAGGEFLMLRATHSQQLAYAEVNLTGLPTNDEFIRFHQFDSDFTASFRTYVGIRIPECGQEFRFTYSNYNGDGGFTSVPQVGTPGSGTVNISGPFEVVPAGDGDTITGSSSVRLNNFDFACMKTIPLGCALGCTDCGDCCDPCCGDGCGCCWCPAWDITWSGAVRFADVNSELNYANNIVSVTTPPLLAQRTAISRVDFTGVGLRGGFLGRRYFGKTGMASVFLKGDISLLVGDMDYYASGTDGTGANQFTPVSISCTHVIPVTELEAGASVSLTENVMVSGGYLFSAWHDLGHRAEYDFAATTGGQVVSFDDANILAFDGWFVRAEAAF